MSLDIFKLAYVGKHRLADSLHNEMAATKMKHGGVKHHGNYLICRR